VGIVLSVYLDSKLQYEFHHNIVAKTFRIEHMAMFVVKYIDNQIYGQALDLSIL